MVNLDMFTRKDDPRPYCQEVWDYKGYLVAIDGRLAFIDESSKGKHYGFKSTPPDNWIETLERCFTHYDLPFNDLPEITKESYKPCNGCEGTGLTPKTRECHECEGAGTVYPQTDYNEYECECLSCGGGGEIKTSIRESCPECDGTGETLLNVPFLISEFGDKEFALSGHYIEKIKTLPNVKVAWLPESNPMYVFKFDGGVGACMPMTL